MNSPIHKSLHILITLLGYGSLALFIPLVMVEQYLYDLWPQESILISSILSTLIFILWFRYIIRMERKNYGNLQPFTVFLICFLPICHFVLILFAYMISRDDYRSGFGFG